MSNGVRDKLLKYESESEFETISTLALLTLIDDTVITKGKVANLEKKMYAIMIVGGGAWSVTLLIIEKIFF